MKKIFLLLVLCILSLSLSSCTVTDSRVVDMDNMLWKNPDFNIEATSTQLQNQEHLNLPENKEDYFSSIEVEGQKYSCTIGLTNRMFAVWLYDDSTYGKDEFKDNIGDSIICFYDPSYPESKDSFLDGFYDNPEKVKDKDYKYTMNVRLTESGQYYEYCQANNIEFPKTITFYGYVI